MKNKNSKSKMPISIVLIIVWMFFMIIRTIVKLISLERFQLNKLFFGSNLALFNYIIDAIILVAFIIIITLFILRKRNSWKYFIVLMAVLIIGVIMSMFYVSSTIAILFTNSPDEVSFIKTFTYMTLFLLILFYALLAYVVYRKKEYFVK